MFVHLKLHSEYSMVDSTVRLGALVGQLRAMQMPAIALTDDGNVSAMVKFFKACEKAGIKPIIGADVWVRDGDLARVTLLVMNQAGYINLSTLIGGAYAKRVSGEPAIIEFAALRTRHHGLIALTGFDGHAAPLLSAGKVDAATALLQRWSSLFVDRLYIALSRCGRSGEAAFLESAVDLAIALDLPAVACNDVRFLTRDEFQVHEARAAIAAGYTLNDPRRPLNTSAEQYLKSPEEMLELFADLPGAIENSVEIAKRCTLELAVGSYHLPDYPTPSGEDLSSFLVSESERGLRDRLATLQRLGQLSASEDEYFERLHTELQVIQSMGFAGYFLIVADFIRWAKANSVPVGPGRGSGAGSLVAYALLITDLDPLRYELLFERFLNPERVSMPDFDIDFCMEGRDRVINYVRERYGHDHVCQIITHGTMAAKACVRDAGRTLGLPFPAVDGIAKLIPNTLGIELGDALGLTENSQKNKDLVSSELKARFEDIDDEAHTVLTLALKLEGLTRNAGKHAGGVVIAPAPITQYCPLYAESAEDDLVAQFDMGDLETIGLVKFDFLGLRTLTILDWAVHAIAQRTGTTLDLNALPLDDAATFALLKACQTTAVFQLESRGMKELVKKLQPDCFEEIIALCALFRPGPLQSGMVDSFVNRKHGREEVAYMHPLLETLLRPTYGVIVYQEQVMQIAQVLAGYTLGGADLLRRAMGKKKPEEMAKQREIFNRGAADNQIDAGLANQIFDLMEKFAEYGFNKSHSAAYALLAYQTAYLKAHYPAEFMAAVLSSDMDNLDKVVEFLSDAQQQGLTVLSPDVNSADYPFRATDAKTICYGLGAVKGVGQHISRTIALVRKQDGAFTDLYDFCRRLNHARPNKRVLEALLSAGALDALGPNRATLMAVLPDALSAAEQALRDEQSGQVDMFASSPAVVAAPRQIAALAELPMRDKLKAERDVLGWYLSGHPVSLERESLVDILSGTIADIHSRTDRERRGRRDDPSVFVLGQVGLMRRRGDNMANVQIEDASGRIECSFFTDAWRGYGHLVEKDAIVLVEGPAQYDEFAGATVIKVRRVWPLAAALSAFTQQLLIDASPRRPSFAENLRALLTPLRDPRGASVRITLQLAPGSVCIDLDDQWRVAVTPELLTTLRGWPVVLSATPVLRRDQADVEMAA